MKIGQPTRKLGRYIMKIGQPTRQGIKTHYFYPFGGVRVRVS
jgi:hypothetical protein